MDNCSATLIIKNFTPYTPDESHWLYGSGASFLKSEDGQDWYDCQSKFKEETLKLQIAPDGRLLAITKDISTLFPYNCSVVEVESLPESIEVKNNRLQGDYAYDIDNQTVGERVLSEAESKVNVDKKIKNILSSIGDKISPLQYAKDLDIITDEELTLLTAYKKYAVEVSRVKSQDGYPLSVVWPDIPDDNLGS